MMRMRRQPGNRTYQVETHYMDDEDNEHDVTVHFLVEPPEPDVNFHGEIVLEGIFYEDEGDITDRLSRNEIDQIESNVDDEVAGWDESHV